MRPGALGRSEREIAMIYSLTGKVLKKGLNFVVLSCGGVGYYLSLIHI